jgi:glycine hydroxymethyltransferase
MQALEKVNIEGFFNDSLENKDPELFGAIAREADRQQNQIELIASENIVSRAVLEAQGSVLTNKYAEGYPHKRYYGGCEYVDEAEILAIDRAKKLFNCEYVNVQPHSGSQANQAVNLALVQPGDTILGMALNAGGHLTHGAKPNQSGKWFNAVQYGVSQSDNLIDFDQVEALAMEHKPKIIIAGCSAYPREIDFKKFRTIADKVGAYLHVDMAHIAGLVATGLHQNPLLIADVVTTTTHKTLRGPRGGMILSNNPDLGKKLNSAIFPGLQGGPLMHVIAAKAVAFLEALQPEYKIYMQKVVANAKALGRSLENHGVELVTGGTDTHLLLADLRPLHVTGNIAEDSLERAGLTLNKNSIPFDPQLPQVTSGVRVGSPACTTRGFGEKEFIRVGELIAEVLIGLKNNPTDNSKTEREVNVKVLELLKNFPIY